MKNWQWVVVLALVVAVATALPAVGAPSPNTVAGKAMRLAKQANARSKKALKQSRKRGPVGARGPTGARGQAGTDGANGQAGAAGSPGPAGTARAYAQVNALSNTYVSTRTKGFTGSVGRPGGIGVFCLTIDPALGIDPEKVAAIASPEFGNTSDHGGSAEVRGGATSSCSSGQFAVHTFDTAGVNSNTVSFMIIVP
jgi:hypothetical protein